MVNALHFFIAHASSIAAFATVVMALFTIVLAGAAFYQGRLIKREFISTHRPQIIIKAVKISMVAHENGFSSAKFTYANAGQTAATLKKIGARVFESDRPWTRGDREIQFCGVDTFPKKLEPGEEAAGFTAKQFDWTHRNHIWHCAGFIEYIDGRGITRRTGFCRRWNPSTMDWEKTDNEEYEYAY